jgi:hypothetical protein
MADVVARLAKQGALIQGALKRLDEHEVSSREAMARRRAAQVGIIKRLEDQEGWFQRIEVAVARMQPQQCAPEIMAGTEDAADSAGEFVRTIHVQYGRLFQNIGRVEQEFTSLLQKQAEEIALLKQQIRILQGEQGDAS